MGRKPPRLRVGAFISCEYAYKPGSVLIVIYLRVPSPVRSSHLGSSRAGLCSHTGVAPDRVYSDGRFHTPSGELLPRLSTLTSSTQSRRAVYLCCTFPEVAFGGRYPLSLPCGARTFLTTGLSAWPRDCLSYSPVYFSGIRRDCQRLAAMRPPPRRKTPGPSAENTGWPAERS